MNAEQTHKEERVVCKSFVHSCGCGPSSSVHSQIRVFTEYLVPISRSGMIFEWVSRPQGFPNKTITTTNDIHKSRDWLIRSCLLVSFTSSLFF